MAVKKKGAPAKLRLAKVLPAEDAGPVEGTRQTHVLANGQKVNGVWRDEKLCCPTCSRKLPVGPNTSERLEKRRLRQETLKRSAQEHFRYMAEMIKKNARRLGEHEPSDGEIAKMMMVSAAE